MKNKKPTTKAGTWLIVNSRWDDGMRGFFVRINNTGGPDDMHRHVLAIENEAHAATLRELREEVEGIQMSCQLIAVDEEVIFNSILAAIDKKLE